MSKTENVELTVPLFVLLQMGTECFFRIEP
jgi:hypothetical protein